MDFTFGIITYKDQEDNINRIIDSIEEQGIDNYEIIIVGYSRINKTLYPEVNYIEAKDLAVEGVIAFL